MTLPWAFDLLTVMECVNEEFGKTNVWFSFIFIALRRIFTNAQNP